MKETFILRTTELHSTNGVVHIHTIGYSADEEMYIERDARSLMEDIPSLYMMAKQAIKQDEEHQLKKFVNFKKELADDWKGKKGRKKSIL